MLLSRSFLLLPVALVTALDLGKFTGANIRNVSSTIAATIISDYTTPGQAEGVGLFSEDVYWYEAGIVWGSLIDYWSYTGDDKYNNQVAQALLAQSSVNHDFMPPNQTKTESNSDQAIWGLAALTAAERKLSQSSGGVLTWVDMAIAVFNLQAARWDETCGGGFRWQIFSFNKGYDIKNAETQAFFFLLAARLARFTGNQTYVDWATKSYEWTESIGLIGKEGQVYDATVVEGGCSKIDNKIQWSWNNAAFLYGSAVMATLPESNSSSTWLDRTDKFTSSIAIFFNQSNDILTEIACEPQHTCINSQYILKGLTSQWLGEITELNIPVKNTNVTQTISKYLFNSALAAAKQCNGTVDDRINVCGSTWNSTFDGETGMEQQLAALNIIVANSAKDASEGGLSTPIVPSGSPSSLSGAATPFPSKPSVAVKGFESILMGTAGWLWMVAAATVWGMCI